MATATSTEMVMPRLSDSMEEGTIIAWLIPTGSPVTAGQDLLEVETDKANMTVAADETGLLEILAPEGTTLAVGEPIARFGAGEGPTPPKPAGVEGPTPPASEVATPASEVATPASEVSTSAPEAPAPVPPVDAGDRHRATPLARRIAAIHGLTIDSIGTGSGTGGRIVKADVLAAAGIAPTPSPVAPSSAGATARADVDPPKAEGAKGGGTLVEPTRLQAVIARRMAEAKATIPHFQVETEVRMSAAMELRAELKRLAGEGPVPSFNDLIVRAAAMALRDHPKANGSFRDGSFELHDHVNVGIAVAADGALVVPTVFDADRKSLGEIGRESRRLAERVRAGEVTPPELAGGTFTVSNLGMFGMTAIYPVINLPQAAILGVGKAREILVRGPDGEIEDAASMTLTLSCDHRILYGAEAAEFLAAVRALLEAPLLLAL